LIWLAVEGQPIGSEVRVTGGGTVEVEAEVRSILPVHALQIMQAGRVVAEVADEKGSRHLRLHERLTVRGDTWLAARCAGPGYTARPHHDVRGRGVMAHTSPIYVRCGEHYSLMDADALHYMLTLASGGLEHIRRLGLQYPAGRVTHWHGHEDHLAQLEKPFHEAAAALHRRLHEQGIAH
jgi:hypothetical protein